MPLMSLMLISPLPLLISPFPPIVIADSGDHGHGAYRA
jgi:hypothetical protein